jgi:hypothetical protein
MLCRQVMQVFPILAGVLSGWMQSEINPKKTELGFNQQKNSLAIPQ